MVGWFLSVWKELGQSIFDPHVCETEMSQSEKLKLNTKVQEKLFNKHLSLILPYFNSRGTLG